MASSSADSLVYGICNENLLDPRPLTCGHSYCGPPSLCLTSLQNEKDEFRCAVCRSDHNLKAEQIKLLYGVRYFMQGSSKIEADDDFRLPCSVNPKRDYTLWGSNCNVMICDDYFEEMHDDHSIRRLKKYLMSRISTSLFFP